MDQKDPKYQKMQKGNPYLILKFATFWKKMCAVGQIVSEICLKTSSLKYVGRSFHKIYLFLDNPHILITVDIWVEIKISISGFLRFLPKRRKTFTNPEMEILISTQYQQLSGSEGYPGIGIFYENSFKCIFKKLVLGISRKLFDLQRTIFFQNVANSKLIWVTFLHFLIFRVFWSK